MSMMFDTLLYLGRNGEVDPSQLEAGFAALSLTGCAPEKLLVKYARNADAVDLDDPGEDLSAHELIFHYGAISALRSGEDFAWLGEFSRFDSDADKVFKAVALFKLAAFFGFGELYTRGDTALEKTLWNGSFSDPWFRHVCLYELLARDITPHQPNPWGHVRNHGRNYVEMFGTEERIRQVRQGRVARAFAQGLLRRIGDAALNPELKPAYKAFFEAYIKSHNVHRASQMQWAHPHEAWDFATMRRRLLAGLLDEQFNQTTLTRILEAAAC